MPIKKTVKKPIKKTTKRTTKRTTKKPKGFDLRWPSKRTKKVEKGERPSPSEHAGAFKNKIKEGNDGNDYISLPDKNGIYKWKKIKDMNETKTPEEYWLQFPDNTKPILNITPLLNKLKLVKDELRKHGIYMFRIGWKNVGNWIDYAWDDAQAMLEKIPKVKKYVEENGEYSTLDAASMLFWTAHGEYGAKRDGTLNIQHNIHRKDLPIVKEIFEKHFGKKYFWKGSNKKTIQVKL